MITKSKRDELLEKIQNFYPYMQMPNEINGSPMANNLQHCIQEAIKSYVDDCFRVLLTDLYTQEDLESDLKLDKKTS